MQHRSGIVTLLVLAVGACAGRGATSTAAPADDLATARASLLAADRAHAAAADTGGMTAFARALAEDAVLLYPTKPIVRGRAAALALLDSLPGAAARRMRWSPVRVDVSADATRGYTLGYGARTIPDTSGTRTIPLKYLAFWRRSATGTWEVQAWMLGGGADGAPDAAPPGCETPTVARYPSTARADGDTLRASLLRADASFSALSADSGAAPAFATFVADDGVGLGAGPAMSCGPAAMRQAFEHAGPGALTWEPRLADAAPSGDLGFTVGVAGFRSSSQTLYSKYLTIWRRQRSGEWRFVADGGNAAPAPAP